MSKKNKTKLLVLTSFFFGICLISGEVFSSTLKNNLSKIDRKLATFDPGGKNLKQPFEKKIPKAQVSGFLKNWSDFLLEEKWGYRSHNQNNRFLQLQNLAELEVDYNITQGIDVKAIAHMLYDGGTTGKAAQDFPPIVQTELPSYIMMASGCFENFTLAIENLGWTFG